MPADSPPHDWRAALAGLGGLGGPGEASDPEAERATLRPLGLQFELRRRVERRSGQWRGPRDEPAKRAASVDRLAVRPVTEGSRGQAKRHAVVWPAGSAHRFYGKE